MNTNKLQYYIALTLLPGFGPVKIKKTLNEYQNPINYFEKTTSLLPTPSLFKVNETIKHFKQKVLDLAKAEIEFCEKNNIKIITIHDKNYPTLLKEAYDPPIVLYAKGNTDINNYSKSISVVGTRKATQYGKSACNSILDELASKHNFLIISGLALGIDTCAHKAAIDNNLPTIAVLGHGFSFLYPGNNKKLASKIIEKGGMLLSEYTHQTKPEGFNFVKRNRIIAGISQGTLVAESKIRGGALITASMALSYDREVMAIPGRLWDETSKGCNMLIKQNKASLVENADDVEKCLNWDLFTTQSLKKPTIGVKLTKEEKAIVEFLQKEKGKAEINVLSKLTGIDLSSLALHLINLEIKGVIKSLPGNFYQLI